MLKDQLQSSSLEKVLLDRAMRVGIPHTSSIHVPKPRIETRAPLMKLPEITRHGSK